MTLSKVPKLNESDDEDNRDTTQLDSPNEQSLEMYPGTLTFRNRDVEKEYLSDVAKQRWPVLLFIFCFDLICYIFRVAAKGVKLSASMSRTSACSQVFWEFAPQFANMVLLYSFIGLLNRRSSRSGSAAAHQEETMISGLMSMAICSLLASLTPDNSSDYVYVAFFLICTSTFLKIRWWVGSAILIAPVVLVQVWPGCKNLPPDATVHIVVAWGVGALMTYLAEWYRRQTFANQKVAATAMQKEVREAQARVKVQKELAEAQAQAAQRALVVAQEKAANDAKSEFMSLMCHEVRTPLNGCLASAEMLLETPLAEEQRELANTIRVSGSILLSTVSNFLDYFKMEAGKQLDIVRQPVQLQEVVADVHRIIEAMLGNNCGVTLQTPDTRWVPQVIYVDPDRLRGILLNLYTNAAKFTKQGYIHLRVRAVPHNSEPKVPDGYYSVRVTPSYSPDPRRSFSSSSRAPSFDPFSTLNTSSQPTSSSHRAFSFREPSPAGSSLLTFSSASAATTPDYQNTRLQQLKAEFLDSSARNTSTRNLRASLDSSSPCVSSKRSGADVNAFRVGRKSCSSVGTSSIGPYGMGVNSSTSDDLKDFNIPTEQSHGGENHNMFDDDDAGNWLLFEVIDTGVGIAENELQALFKEFVQGTEAAMRKPRSRGGTGLGLSICAKQVSLLGGKIGAHSKLGSGSVFWFIIPERWGMPLSSRQRLQHNVGPSSDSAYRPRWSLDLHELPHQCLSPSQRLDHYRSSRERGRADTESQREGDISIDGGVVGFEGRREDGSYGEMSETARKVAEAAEHELGERSWRAEREKRMVQFVYDNELVVDHDSRLQNQYTKSVGQGPAKLNPQKEREGDSREQEGEHDDQKGNQQDKLTGQDLSSLTQHKDREASGRDKANTEIPMSESCVLSSSGASSVTSSLSVHSTQAVTGAQVVNTSRSAHNASSSSTTVVGSVSKEVASSSHGAAGISGPSPRMRTSNSFESLLSQPGQNSLVLQLLDTASTNGQSSQGQVILAPPPNSRRSLNRERRSMQLATITESAKGERGSMDSDGREGASAVDTGLAPTAAQSASTPSKPASQAAKSGVEADGKQVAESAGTDPHHGSAGSQQGAQAVPTIWISTTCSVGNQPGGTTGVTPSATAQPPAPPAITVVNNFSMHILSLLDNASLRSQISETDVPGTASDPLLSSPLVSSDSALPHPSTPSHATVTTTTTATFGASNTAVQSNTPTVVANAHPQPGSTSPPMTIPSSTMTWQLLNATRSDTHTPSTPANSQSTTDLPAPAAVSSTSASEQLPGSCPTGESPPSDSSAQSRKASANSMRRSTSNPVINSLTRNGRNSSDKTRGCHSMDASRRTAPGDGNSNISVSSGDGKGVGVRSEKKEGRLSGFSVGPSGRMEGFVGEKTAASRLSQCSTSSTGQQAVLGTTSSGRPNLTMLAGKRALLVEDNLINQTVARKMLTSLGMVCEVASNGKEAVNVVEAALKKCAEETSPAASNPMFDVVLMDMAMPVMGGVEATRVIRDLGVTVPIVAMTANASEKDRDECRAAGMDGFLSKPVLKDRLGDAIIRVLHGQDCFSERSLRKHSFSA